MSRLKSSQSTLKFRHCGASLTWVECSDSRAMDCSRIIIPHFSPYGQILSTCVRPYDGHGFHHLIQAQIKMCCLSWLSHDCRLLSQVVSLYLVRSWMCVTPYNGHVFWHLIQTQIKRCHLWYSTHVFVLFTQVVRTDLSSLCIAQLFGQMSSLIYLNDQTEASTNWHSGIR